MVWSCAGEKGEYICTRFSENTQRSFDKMESADEEVENIFKNKFDFGKTKVLHLRPAFRRRLEKEVLLTY